MSDQREIATLGGGCFWCLEAVYREISGVETVISGYAGGHVEEPTYEEVCTGATGHNEVVRVVFDPAVIPFEALLRAFWEVSERFLRGVYLRLITESKGNPSVFSRRPNCRQSSFLRTSYCTHP